MYIAVAVFISAVIGYSCSVAFGPAGLFISLPVAIILGLVGGTLQAKSEF